MFVVLNAASGAQPTASVQAVIEAQLREAGRDHAVLASTVTGGLEAATRHAVELALARGGALVAAGGDGTLNRVAQAALEADLPFGAIALGTFNYFARAQALPLDVAAATRALLSPRLRAVQVGVVNGRVFLVNASLGLYPQLLADREQFKARFGRHRAVAFAAAIGTILQSRRRLDLAVEAQAGTRTLRTAALVVDNNRLQLEQLGLPEAEAVEQGRLVAMFVKPSAPGALLGLLARALLRGLAGTPEVERLAVRRLRVTLLGAAARATLSVAVDGETLRMSSPLEFSVAPRPLQLIVPP
ncbi:MAG: diacylglycerol kinase [Steroidobacteraceae bacterium]|nr:diacylglycerol kinase [Steroidobacteraceae bacterium]